ncbi:AAA domain-containing protein, partial [bacterium]|nr:AAA domain-containing protein [bacterium]
ESARQHLMKAYTMATDLGIPREECLSLEFLGDVYRDEGRPEEARRFYQRGMAIAERIAPEGDLVMELLRRDGECHVIEGKAGEGLEILARALTYARKVGDRFEEGVVLRCLAEGLLKVRHLEQALSYAEQAARQLEDIEAQHEHAIARLVAAEIQLTRCDDVGSHDDPRALLDAAWEHLLIAQGICRKLAIEHWTTAVKILQSRVARRRAEEARYASPTGDATVGRVSDDPGDVVIAESRAMKEVLQAVDAFAPYDEPVLITGETGTGKEVVARLLHRGSRREDAPFVAVNVSAIPDTMFEREFFGHVKGAFSGAETGSGGLAAEADGGTLFLDEIGDLSPAMQTKLLRLLQDGSYHTLGDPSARQADLRILAATNSDLEAAVRGGRFREDLYYRLATLVVPVPALRDRPEDVEPLLDHFLSVAAGRTVQAAEFFGAQNLKLLQKYHWPGNVREVSLIARRAAISHRSLGRVEIEVGTGPEAMLLRGDGQAMAAAAGAEADEPALNRARILLALEEAGGNRSEAARRLGVSRATLYRRLARHDLDLEP